MYYHNLPRTGQIQVGHARAVRVRRLVSADHTQPYWAEQDLGFSFKKIFKPLKYLNPAVQLKMTGKVLKGVGKGLGKVVKGLGRMVKMPGKGGGDAPIDEGMPEQVARQGPQQDFGPSEAEGSGMLGGLSPLTLGLLIGAPILLMFVMKKK